MGARVIEGDCLSVMAGMAEKAVDCIVTDPPYGLSNHKPEDVVACLRAWLDGAPYRPNKRGFMNRAWDAWVPGPEVWREALRVLKPGGHMLVFAGTRSMDLMSMAVRLAGFELRDAIGYAHDTGTAPVLAWTHGQGFPKSVNIAKAIETKLVTGKARPEDIRRHNMGETYQRSGRGRVNYDHGAGSAMNGTTEDMALTTAEAQRWNGFGSALKPSWEPVILARKPLDGTLAETVLRWGTGGLNIDACRVPFAGAADERESKTKNQHGDFGSGPMTNQIFGKYTKDRENYDPSGRFPANVLHDGSAEVLASFAAVGGRGADGAGDPDRSAARFFYCAKAQKHDRDGSAHNTVKPLALMRYMVKLVCPPGGVVLDPFAGSGTTGLAAVECGFDTILIEQIAEYAEDCRRRLAMFME